MKRNTSKVKGNNSHMNSLPSFGDAMQLDQAIYQLAAYDTSNGMLFVPESVDQAMSFQRGIAKKFNYFKRLIQNGEMSLNDLEDMVVYKNGPFPNNRNMNIEQAIDNIMKQNQQVQPEEDSNDVVAKLLKKIFQDVMAVPGQDPSILKVQPINSETPIEESFSNRVLPTDVRPKISKGKNAKKPKSKLPKNPTDQKSETDP